MAHFFMALSLLLLLANVTEADDSKKKSTFLISHHWVLAISSGFLKASTRPSMNPFRPW